MSDPYCIIIVGMVGSLVHSLPCAFVTISRTAPLRRPKSPFPFTHAYDSTPNTTTVESLRGKRSA
jgi:hypothetical protein